MKPKKPNPKQNKGFTLIEVAVSVFIFFSVLVIILGFFGYAIKGQKKALASQEISDQISYVMEYISRSARMAIKDTAGTCITAGRNYEITNPLPGYSCIRFLNHEEQCQEFCFDSNSEQLKRRKSNDSGSGGLTGSEVDLTSSKLKVNSVQFNIIGDAIGDNIQPRVTISLDVEKRQTRPEYNAKIKIQSTISQRNLDVN